MNKSVKDGLVIVGSAVAGGWGGSLGTAKIGALLGLRFGPWGALIGTTAGALAGAALAKKLLANGAAVAELETQENLGVEEDLGVPENLETQAS